MSANLIEGSSDALTKAVRRVLTALIRLLVGQGVALQQVIEMLKEIYVHEAESNLKKNNERVTNSRISVISGVHRKDVKRILEQAEKSDAPPKKTNLSARLLSLWLGDKDFLDADNKPLLLTKNTNPDTISFEDLVLRGSNDIRSRAILDEWMQRGLVKIDDKDRVVLQQDAIYPARSQQDRLYYFGRNTADHIACCDYNIHTTKNTLPERAVFFDRLSHTSIDQLEQLSKTLGDEALQKLNAKAITLAEQDDAKERAEGRFTFGLYFYREQEHYTDE